MQENFNIGQVITGLSEERLTKYLLNVKNDSKKALSLYEYNTKLSECFYTPLQGLEIILRNKIDKTLSRDFGEDWLISGKVKLEFIQEESVKRALSKSKIELTIPKLIAELNLGFWTSLFGRKYEELWRHQLRYVFSMSTSPLTRKAILKNLNNIRELRNRIAHHEPIFNRDLGKDHQYIIDTIGLICPHTKKWIEKASRFNNVYKPQIGKL